MLSEAELIEAYIAGLGGVDGLRAVEAAVRADQIEKDACVADRQDYSTRVWAETPEADARARAIADAIRAQLPGTGLDTEKEGDRG